MRKFHGVIGYAISTETAPDVYRNQYVEKMVAGDVISLYNNIINGSGLNDNITLNCKFSVVANGFMLDNLHAMCYIVYRGTKWKITNVDDTALPRVYINVGGVYNEEPSGLSEYAES